VQYSVILGYQSTGCYVPIATFWWAYQNDSKGQIAVLLKRQLHTHSGHTDVLKKRLLSTQSRQF
jgi:hypothetical protein